MSLIQGYLNKRVLVLTTDGRTLLGTLLSCDNSTNLVLTHTIERVIFPPDSAEASYERDWGVYVVRGDTVCVVGLVDEELDGKINWGEVRGSVVGSTRHVG